MSCGNCETCSCSGSSPEKDFTDVLETAMKFNTSLGNLIATLDSMLAKRGLEGVGISIGNDLATTIVHLHPENVCISLDTLGIDKLMNLSKEELISEIEAYHVQLTHLTV